MYIIEVIPLTTLPPQVPQVLSYFFERELPRGAVVEIDLGKRAAKGIVLSSKPLAQQKIFVKKSAFRLKKLSRIIHETPRVEDWQFKISDWLARNYFAPLGLSLKTVLPPFFGTKQYAMAGYQNLLPPNHTAPRPIIARMSFSDAAAHISQYLKIDGQTLILLPDKVMLEHFSAQLREKGLDHAPLHAGLPRRAYTGLWQSIASGHTKIMASTRIGLFLPFQKLTAIILIDPSHEAYKSDRSPRYNTRDLANFICELYGAQLILAVFMPSVEDFYAGRQKKYLLRDDPNSEKNVRPELIDMVAELKTGNFSLLGRRLQNALRESMAKRERILFFSARRAYAGILLCQNCGVAPRCHNCDIPLRVHKFSDSRGNESMLICYRCGAYQKFPPQCANCNSYKLIPAGAAGSQRIEEELRSFLAREKNEKKRVFIFDTDLIRTPAQEKEIWEEIELADRPILVSSALIFSYIFARRFDLIALPTADALLSSPDFRTDERFLQQVKKLYCFRPSKVLMQTFHPENRIMQFLKQDSYHQFYEEELKVRRELSYPPFVRLVKLTFRHKDQTKAAQAARMLGEKLRLAIGQLGLTNAVAVAGPAPALVTRERGLYFFTILLKFSPDVARLDMLLKYVPSHWSVDVDPRQIV